MLSRQCHARILDFRYTGIVIFFFRACLAVFVLTLIYSNTYRFW
jgi:hypothetical protein